MTTELTKAAQQALEACPFCGGKNIKVHSYSDAVIGGEPDAFAQCHDCSVTGPNGKTESEAAEAWNTRALTQRPAAQTEREADGLPLIVAGAIFDFAGFMTTRSEVIEIGSTAEAGPVADLVKEWAELRGLALADAAVLSWQLHINCASPPAPQQATPGWSYTQTRRVDENTVDIGRVVAFADERATPEPTVTYATVRDAEDELHIECRFSDGQKFAAVHVAQGFDNLAHRIETMLNGAQQATPEPVLFNGLTESETNATASAMGLTATPPQQAAGEPVEEVVAWEYQNQHGNKFLTHSDPNKWHPHDQDGFKSFRPLVYGDTHPAPGVPEAWTDEQCLEFMCVALRHVEYKRGTKGPTCDDIRLGVARALAAQAKGADK